MIIHGIGIDIINVARIKNAVKKNKKFIKKIFSTNEIKYCNKKKLGFNSYATSFAAKEAFVKALGIGFRKGLSYKEVEVLRDNLGQPKIKLVGKNKNIVQKILKKKFKVSLSLSDDTPYALAIVTITI